MKRVSYDRLIAKAFDELEAELEKYGLEYLFGQPYLEELFFENWHHDPRDNCFYCMDIQIYVRQAVEADLMTEQDELEFLLEYLLQVKP